MLFPSPLALIGRPGLFRFRSETGLWTILEPGSHACILTRFFSQGRSRMMSSSVKGPQVDTGLPCGVLTPPAVSSWAWQLFCSGVTVATEVSGMAMGMGPWVRRRRACSARSKHTWRFLSCCCRALLRPLRTGGRFAQRATTSSCTRFWPSGPRCAPAKRQVTL